MSKLLCLIGLHRWVAKEITHFDGNAFFGNCAVHYRCARCAKTRSEIMFDPRRQS